ncbi:MAG: hypothetical protein FJW36_11345 [Acidobacteria bacterium]|nr:hypothetical protein [Acidobacteriota bacterium]
MTRRHTLAMASLLASCQKPDAANTYMKLVLALGVHEPSYVDAYYGPPQLKQQAENENLTLDQIRDRAHSFLSSLDEPNVLRRQFLVIQTKSLVKRTEMLSGRKFTFDEESQHLYDTVAPVIPEATFEKAIQQLDSLLPSKGPIAERHALYRNSFNIPADRVDACFRAAVDESRSITQKHIALPAEESFEIEYVKGKVWSAYNWYRSRYKSLIQVNLDLPVEIGRIVTLAAHEGYPGHHVYNTLLEQHLVNGKGWREFSIYPLFSPQSCIAEGTAEYGVGLTFPAVSSLAFHEQILFPKAGLDPKQAAHYLKVLSALASLSHAVNQAARQYLDDKINRAACQQYLERYSLMTAPKAEQRIRFIEANRAYVITYNHGQDLIRTYLAKQPDQWKAFEALLSSPRLPSTLKS